jgi:hypothetical protein
MYASAGAVCLLAQLTSFMTASSITAMSYSPMTVCLKMISAGTKRLKPCLYFYLGILGVFRFTNTLMRAGIHRPETVGMFNFLQMLALKACERLSY